MKNIPKLLKYLRHSKGQVGIYLLCSLLSVIFALFSFGMLAPVLQVLFLGGQPLPMSGNVIMATAMKGLNNILATNDKLTALTYVVILVIIFTTLKNLFRYLAQLILNPLRNSVLRKLRDDMFSKTLSMPIGFFTEERKGDLISRMTNDVNEVEVSIISVLETAIKEPITIILTLTAMLLISPQLTASLLIFLPLVGFIIGKIGKSLKRPSTQSQEQLSEMMSNVDETLAGMRIIKAFNAERHQQLRFRQINNALFRIKNRLAARREAGSPTSETLGVIVVCMILWFGGWLIFSGNNGSLNAALFITFISLFYQIISPVTNLSTAFYNMQKGSAALDRIHQLLDAENTLMEAEEPKRIHSFEQAITLRDVQFAYGDKIILKDINLSIHKGKTIALVGASGAGKSTLVDLIPRFHDVTNGAIYVDGIDLKEYNIFDLRRLIGVVSQEPILFNDTIYNNITLGTGGKTKEEVEQAARIANAHDFIVRKEQGYQTVVGDRGAKLSGGERQRITIARAILKNPPILILDEATSSLDTQSERIVQDAINVLMKNRTCIVIAHRLSTVQHADEIIVLHQGIIVERGNHQSLMDLHGHYYQLVSMQQVK
jgi:subfamily B ATP-binding cassette protein MsbA